jgi:hypothetical protein
MPSNGWNFFAIVLGIAAAVLVVLALAVYYGYIDTSLVDNLTDGELGTFGVLAIAGAVG